MKTALIWFRRDLRITDNPAFAAACNNNDRVLPLFILHRSTQALGAAQQWWLHHSLKALDDSLQKLNLRLLLRRGEPLTILRELITSNSIDTIYWNQGYDAVAIEDERNIRTDLLQRGVEVESSNGSLLNEPWTIKNQNGDFFKVFTPYWKRCLNSMKIPKVTTISNHPQLANSATDELVDWELLPKNSNWASNFSNDWQPGEVGAQTRLDKFIESHLTTYKINRNIPAINATSKLSPHLHFGEISPWQVWRAVDLATLDKSIDSGSVDQFLSEMGWREFCYYLHYHFPKLTQTNFKNDIDNIVWENNETLLTSWQKGKTGYPMVDAGMRELWSTGFMHNRVRMIVASFLTKDLLIDWRLGANWFLDTLVDADEANNSANWQWVAGCGADAAPYYRIFNPILQSKKFDPSGDYIRRWVPELANVKAPDIHEPWKYETGFSLKNYPPPIINHKEARIRALGLYKVLRNKEHVKHSKT